MFSSLFVCLPVSNFAQKTSERTCMKFSGKDGNATVNKKFGGDPDRRLDIVFRIRYYWEIRKMVNGHKSAARTDSPDGGTGKTCLGGGMHCPSASGCILREQLR